MENFHTQSGGLILGVIRMTPPLAQIVIREDSLIINHSLFFKLVFTSEDIIDIIPNYDFFEKGVVIKHNKSKYNSKIIFRTFKPDKLIEEIKNTGFFKQKNND